jgi:hypothetical protein
MIEGDQMYRLSRPMGSRFRLVRRVLTVTLLAVVMTIAAITVTGAAPPPDVGPPQQPPIAGAFQVTPDHGPAGFQVTLKGFCGFPAHDVLPAFGPPANPAALFYLHVRLKPSPFGQFSIVETVPFPEPPGGYLFSIACIANDGSSVLLPSQLFEVTPDVTRGG